MATKREMVTTVPRLVVQQKATALPVAVVKSQPPQGKTKYETHSHPIHSGPGGKHQTHMYQVWNTNLLQRNSTLRQILVRPKDKDPKEKASGIIYSYQCGVIKCGEEYISETSRTLGNTMRNTWGNPTIQAHRVNSLEINLALTISTS